MTEGGGAAAGGAPGGGGGGGMPGGGAGPQGGAEKQMPTPAGGAGATPEGPGGGGQNAQEAAGKGASAGSESNSKAPEGEGQVVGWWSQTIIEGGGPGLAAYRTDGEEQKKGKTSGREPEEGPGQKQEPPQVFVNMGIRAAVFFGAALLAQKVMKVEDVDPKDVLNGVSPTAARGAAQEHQQGQGR